MLNSAEGKYWERVDSANWKSLENERALTKPMYQIFVFSYQETSSHDFARCGIRAKCWSSTSMTYVNFTNVLDRIEHGHIMFIIYEGQTSNHHMQNRWLKDFQNNVRSGTLSVYHGLRFYTTFHIQIPSLCRCHSDKFEASKIGFCRLAAYFEK